MASVSPNAVMRSVMPMDNPNAAIRMPRLEGRAQSLRHSDDRVAAMPVPRAGRGRAWSSWCLSEISCGGSVGGVLGEAVLGGLPCELHEDVLQPCSLLDQLVQ